VINPAPFVTVIAISYNQEMYVIDTLNSIRNQTYAHIQLIVSDDGSTDNTKSLIRKWLKENWPDAKFLDHANNMGVTRNLNSALPFIEGEYYQFIGCEDVMLPHKIETQVKLLQQHTDAAIVYSDMYLMNETGYIDNKTYYKKYPDNVPQSGALYGELIKKCFVATPTALMRSDVVKKLKKYNEHLDIDDYDFWVRASKEFNFLYHNDVTMYYRELPKSVSKRDGIFRFRNRFLLYYLNYDKREPYKKVFNERLMFSLKNLRSLHYKKTPWFALKAFTKTGEKKFLFYSIRSCMLFIR
jgi:glycosyltransferase involved in cell wall biosynthesis